MANCLTLTLHHQRQSVRNNLFCFIFFLPRTVHSSSFTTRGVAPSSLYPGLLTCNPSGVGSEKYQHCGREISNCATANFHISHFPIFTLFYPAPLRQAQGPKFSFKSSTLRQAQGPNGIQIIRPFDRLREHFSVSQSPSPPVP